MRLGDGIAVEADSTHVDVVRRVVRCHIPELASCYEAGLVRNPNLGRRVVVRLVVTAEGNVASAVVSRSTVADPAVTTCMNAAFRRWVCPVPEGGGIMVATVPVTLSTEP